MADKIALSVHGGASDSNAYLRKHMRDYEAGLKNAVLAGYKILKRGGSALDAVENAVIMLEDDPFFNAGRGSALNSRGEVEMDASIMDGKKLRAGAVALVKGVKNPVVLARNVMMKTKHVFLSSQGAIDFAQSKEIEFEPNAYFVTEHQFQEFLKEKKREALYKNQRSKRKFGTVGAVALDRNGNLAAATSTGGTSYCLPGRIGDSCIVGAGCYANNKTCAVSGTGSGEILITNVVAHTISMLVQFKKYTLQEACDYIINRVTFKRREHGIGVIAIDPKGNIGISFNTQIMKRAWITTKGELFVKIIR